MCFVVVLHLLLSHYFYTVLLSLWVHWTLLCCCVLCSLSFKFQHHLPGPCRRFLSEHLAGVSFACFPYSIGSPKISSHGHGPEHHILSGSLLCLFLSLASFVFWDSLVIKSAMFLYFWIPSLHLIYPAHTMLSDMNYNVYLLFIGEEFC